MLTTQSKSWEKFTIWMTKLSISENRTGKDFTINTKPNTNCTSKDYSKILTNKILMISARMKMIITISSKSPTCPSRHWTTTTVTHRSKGKKNGPRSRPKPSKSSEICILTTLQDWQLKLLISSDCAAGLRPGFVRLATAIADSRSISEDLWLSWYLIQRICLFSAGKPEIEPKAKLILLAGCWRN